MLQYDPVNRISCKGALQHKYFTTRTHEVHRRSGPPSTCMHASLIVYT